MSGHGGGDGSMTLVLTVSAVERLADPAAVVADAGRWTETVGVVGDDATAAADVSDYVDGLAAEPDVVAGRSGGGLASLRQRLPTERHVLVGTTDQQADIGAALGWEFLSVETAAEEAGWTLGAGEEG